MKVYISCDIEGMAGIPSWEYGSRKKLDYQVGREYMVGELNAAIEGALEAGAREIVVNDSHGNMINLLPGNVRKEAKLIQGVVKPWSMMQGMDRKFDAAAFIGYHAMAGAHEASLAHTYSGVLHVVKVNGAPWGESELNAAFCGTFKTPVVFITGDEALRKEVKKLMPGIQTLAVKKGYGRKAVMSIHPELAREKIRAGMKKALLERKTIKPFHPRSPYTLELELRASEMADMCERIPGTRRLGGRIISYKNRNYREIYRCLLAMLTLAGSVA